MGRVGAFLFTLVIFWGSLWAETKVVSDIDGTLRRTHVRAQGLGLVQLVGQALRLRNPFSGMPELLQELSGGADQECFDLQNIQPLRDYDLSYVTSAPAFLRFLGRGFLKASCFPLGNYYPRGSVFHDSKEFKFRTIVSLLKESGVGQAVLLGDNGEYDVEVYHQVATEYGERNGVEILSFIHMVYDQPVGRKLLPGQRPYLTAADLAVQLFELGLIDGASLERVVSVVHKSVTSRHRGDYEGVFPAWVECGDFAKAFKWPDVVMAPHVRSMIERIDLAITERCGEPVSSPVQLAYEGASPPLQCAEILQ